MEKVEISTFDYKDLIGKTIEIGGVTDDGITIIYGIDISDNHIYVLKVIEEDQNAL